VRIAHISDEHSDVLSQQIIRASKNEGTLARKMAEQYQALHDARMASWEEAKGADVIVCTGDMSEGDSFLRWAREFLAPTPVVYVLGNHEYYGHDMGMLLRDMKHASMGPSYEHVNLLEMESVVIGGVRFLGCTLWTDYAIYGLDKQPHCMWTAARYLADHEEISRSLGGRFLPHHALGIHEKSMEWLERELSVPHDGPTVVCTHHAPAHGSVAMHFVGDDLTPAFVSGLEKFIERHGPALWLHGHTHHSVDYRIGDTRVFSNQWGYPNEGNHRCAIVEV
jgi:hypothetical protein